MVVTCRPDEYAALPTGLEIDQVISIRPLTRKQIADYLADGGTDTAELRAAPCRRSTPADHPHERSAAR